MLLRRSSLLGLALAVVLAKPASGAVPTDPAAKAKVVGQPAALQVQPAVIQLNGPRAQQQLVITGKYADGTVRDLTAFADITLEGDAAAVASPSPASPAASAPVGANAPKAPAPANDSLVNRVRHFVRKLWPSS